MFITAVCVLFLMTSPCLEQITIKNSYGNHFQGQMNIFPTHISLLLGPDPRSLRIYLSLDAIFGAAKVRISSLEKVIFLFSPFGDCTKQLLFFT